MIKIQNEIAFLELFRPIDRDEVQLPPDVKFPLAITDYKAWMEPSGHRTYIVFEDPRDNKGRGIVFKRASGSADPSVSMCEWCHSVRGKSSVGLLTTASGKNKRVGLHLCRDLSCKDKVLATPGVNDIRESTAPHDRVLRLLHRISDFARSNLF